MTCGGVPKSKLYAFIPPFGMWFVNCEFEWVETNGVALDNGDELGCRDCFPGGITIWEKFFSILTKVDQVTAGHRCKRTFHVICHWCWNCVLLLGRDVDIWDVWYEFFLHQDNFTEIEINHFWWRQRVKNRFEQFDRFRPWLRGRHSLLIRCRYGCATENVWGQPSNWESMGRKESDRDDKRQVRSLLVSPSVSGNLNKRICRMYTGTLLSWKNGVRRTTLRSVKLS